MFESPKVEFTGRKISVRTRHTWASGSDQGGEDGEDNPEDDTKDMTACQLAGQHQWLIDVDDDDEAYPDASSMGSKY